MRICTLAFTAAASLGASIISISALAGITPVKNPRAMAELKQMGGALSAAKSMSFNAVTMMPLRGPNGQWVHVFKTAKVEMKRPSGLFVETGGDAFPQRYYFDGRRYSIFAPEQKLYSQTEIPGSPDATATIDEMLAAASKKGGDVFAFADVLIADPLSTWTKDLDGAVFVGESVRNGQRLDHLAMTAEGVDWEVWLDKKDHLPRIVYVKYTGAEKSPSVMIEFSKWKINSSMPASIFAFKVPKDAKKASWKAPEGDHS